MGTLDASEVLPSLQGVTEIRLSFDASEAVYTSTFLMSLSKTLKAWKQKALSAKPGMIWKKKLEMKFELTWLVFIEFFSQYFQILLKASSCFFDCDIVMQYLCFSGQYILSKTGSLLSPDTHLPLAITAMTLWLGCFPSGETTFCFRCCDFVECALSRTNF